jgi:protein gp37
VGEGSKIEWTDHTFNPWIGCRRVSPACDFCYADRGSKRLGAQHRLKLWDGDHYFTGESYWKEPLRWNRHAASFGVRARVFAGSHCDVGEDLPELAATRFRLSVLMRDTPHLLWLLLSKRPGNYRVLFPPWVWSLPNVMAGTTVEDEKRAEERIPEILGLGARGGTFVSYEPALELVDFRPYMAPVAIGLAMAHHNLTGHPCSGGGTSAGCEQCGLSWESGTGIDWLICGGESGSKARPFDIDWARSVRDQCSEMGVAFFMKQVGDNAVIGSDPRYGERVDISLRALIRARKGGDEADWPEDLRGHRSFPKEVGP